MRAVRLLRRQSEPELVEVPTPCPGPGEALVEAAGLCHTDLHIMHGPAGALPYNLPFTLGHESGRHRRGARAGDDRTVRGRSGAGVCAMEVR